MTTSEKGPLHCRRVERSVEDAPPRRQRCYETRVFGSVSDEIVTRARRIRAVILDVDGVLTDGGLHYSQDGEALKRFHVRDGLGMRLLIDPGERRLEPR